MASTAGRGGCRWPETRLGGHFFCLSPPHPFPGRGAEEQALLPAEEGLRQRTGSEHGGVFESPGLPRCLSHHLRQPPPSPPSAVHPTF